MTLKKQQTAVAGNKILIRGALYLSLALAVSLSIISCGKKYTPAQEKYISGVEKFRQEKDKEMKNDPNSPFNQDPNAEFHPLKYYPVNPDFVFSSKLYEYPDKDTVTVMGTKGEARKSIRYGYVKFDYKNTPYRVNVYKGWTRSGQEYYSIWFTDKTTGKETYGVGRYLDFELNPDSNFEYTVDFNLAYSPYCSYSAKYSCAVPTKEDHIDLAIEAGEKNFHN